jgi:DNA-binding transcriptional LysR family regulator
MELSQLKYFQSLANIHQFTKAAQACSVSQSALSRSIAKLEDELGTQLLHRTGQGATLTSAGEHFLFHVDRVLRELATAQQEIAATTEGNSGVVNLSFLHSFGGYILPMLLSEFHARYPQIRIKLNQNNSAYLAQQVAEGKTDLCLCSNMVMSDNLAWNYLWSEELFAVVPKDHPLAVRASIELSELESEPLITMKPSYSLRMVVDQSFELASSHPEVVFEGDDVNTLASLVAARLGVSLLPHIPSTDHLGIVYIPISFPTCRRAVGIAWNANRPLSPAALRFQQFIIKHFAGKKPDTLKDDSWGE